MCNSIYLKKHPNRIPVCWESLQGKRLHYKIKVSKSFHGFNFSLINIKISPNLQVTKAPISNFKYHLIIMIHQCTSACDIWYCISIDQQLIFQLVVFHDRLWPMYGNYKNVFCGKKYGSPSAPYEKKNIYLAIAR